MERDPERLSDDPDVAEDLRSVIDGARQARPNAAAAARIGHGLGLDGGAAGGTGGRGASARSARRIALAVGAAAVVAVIGALWLARSPERTPVATASTPTPAPSAPPPPMPAPAPIASPTSAPDIAPAPPREPVPSRDRAVPRVRLHAGSATTELSEPQLLGRAHSLLGSDPAGALRMVREHERTYPAGAMTQEREVLAIDALARLGRAPEARERASRFLARFPSSALRGRVEALARTAGQ